MEVCSQHSSCTQVSMKHGERLAALETRVDNMEEVQAGMVERLEEAANGLRALAGKIDVAVSHAKNSGCPEHVEEPPASFTRSLNTAWRHFQDNFAMFLIYGGAGLFAWAAVKAVIFREVPPILKRFLG